MMFKRKKSKNSKNFKLDDGAVDYIDNEFPDYDQEDFYDFEQENKEKRRRKKRRKFLFRLCLFCIIIVFINAGILLYLGVISLNNPIKRDFPTRGAVVSDSLGEVKWGTFANQNISFAYIKATKGKTFVDKSFSDNWKNSKDSKVLTGAYHDFDFSADGKKQAENFCNTVGKSMSGRIIPAVDIQMSISESIFSDDAVAIADNLHDFLDYVSDFYGCDVIIICDKTSYVDFYESDFTDYPVWVVSTVSSPKYCENWDLWQYSDRAKTDGYENDSKYYSKLVAKQDMNVEQFKEKFLVK